ncbi:hypothetical protein [Alicyclobacillus shizuokensis]|uniref:hypothetical protein n=1 Tax=Alicyclobacillus shizuokensis TaxID=392014 RepID=UPI00082F6836|nr:hypothetical protein [Alicyclobacillus shizuokensis]
MYARVYNRLVGWLCLAAAAVGWLFGHIGDYMHILPLESCILLGFGVLALLGARSRLRYTVAVALVLGIALFLWGVDGSFQSHLPGATAEPLECALRIIAGAWGVYTAVEDTLSWRRRRLTA